VDLGVSYFNSGQAEVAEGYFRRALRLDPHQPVAHFNVGIVSEHRKDWSGAMQAYHMALQSDPPDDLKDAIVAAMQRIQQQMGRTPPPLTQ
jgi:Tfp pilus assembly protein PilF